jgi:Lrp/AsnC family transcriptional regulator for asnA, asnC and gidA
MDDIDLEIIGILRQDGRVPNTRIGRQVGLSEGAVRKRIEKLIHDDVIQIVAVPNPMLIGYPIVALVNIAVEPAHLLEVAEAVAAMEQVSYAAYCVSPRQLTVEVLARSMDDLRRIAYQDIYALVGVRSVDVSPVSKVIKRTYAADY